jgi:hypothetical protein
MNAHLRRCVLISLSAIVICGESALAQTQQADEERLRREGVERNDAAARAHGFEMERQRQERERQEEARRRSESNSSTGGGYTPSPSGGSSAGSGASSTDFRALGRELLRLPPLPVERNVLLGSWRLEGGGQQSGVLEFGITGRGATPGFGEMMGFMKSIESGQLTCDMSFGRGITFTPTTFSSGGAAGMVGGPVAYRSRKKQVIVAIPGDSRANPMFFEIVGPDRIKSVNVGCPLVRVGAPAANAAANATTAPGNARTGAANSSVPSAAGAMPQVAAVAPSPPPTTLARPSPEVCRNTLLDKLGVVGVNQVRAMSDVRFKETAIEGKEPNTGNLRIDLRGSACDDPRLKATLYDFDANGMLQSITYVWDRPAGPAPAPIFQERVATLTRFHSLPPPQTPGRLQADTSLGRLILQDMPERNLLLEAYAAKK